MKAFFKLEGTSILLSIPIIKFLVCVIIVSVCVCPVFFSNKPLAELFDLVASVHHLKSKHVFEIGVAFVTKRLIYSPHFFEESRENGFLLLTCLLLPLFVFFVHLYGKFELVVDRIFLKRTDIRMHWVRI